jgi:TorA maturation chaperone TorD
MLAAEATITAIQPEERLRAHQYQLLARFLAAPPDAALLRLTSALEGDRSELGEALGILARLAAGFTPKAASEEYHALFIGLVRGELMPYASYYRTGFLYEQPLAALRKDMAALGIARAEDVSEPEDHIAALCDMMAGLILGTFGAPLELSGQRRFFETHLAPWAGRFFTDLEKARAAALYVPIGTMGRVFMAVENAAFGMDH